MLNLPPLTGNSVTVNMPIIGSIHLNWIGNLIRLLIEGVGITALGIVLFTLILKTIVLPLDIYSRYSSKKQALAMQKMRPQMEKLQKQYANDKAMYSAKVQELYKKNGYSMLGACLPMLVSLIIFIVVFNQFSTYSSYANLELYRGMVQAYNDTSVQYVYFEEGLSSLQQKNVVIIKDATGKEVEGKVYVDENGNIVAGENSFLVAFYDDFETAEQVPVYSYTEYLTLKEEGVAISYAVDQQKFESFYQNVYKGDLSKLSYEDVKENAIENKTYTYDQVKDMIGDHDRVYALMIGDFIKTPARERAAEYFRQNRAGFIWVGNLWYPDSMLEKVSPTYKKFKDNMRNYKTDDNLGAVKNQLDEDVYNEVTAALEKEQKAYNGYFVLILFAIGFMLLQQWITMKSQKSLSDLGTVDGSGNQTNKMMMIMMPIMYGIFSFFYSASFSLYMIANTVYSLITTVIINKIMDVKFEKAEAQAEIDRYKRKTYIRKDSAKK